MFLLYAFGCYILRNSRKIIFLLNRKVEGSFVNLLGKILIIDPKMYTIKLDFCKFAPGRFSLAVNGVQVLWRNIRGERAKRASRYDFFNTRFSHEAKTLSGSPGQH